MGRRLDRFPVAAQIHALTVCMTPSMPRRMGFRLGTVLYDGRARERADGPSCSRATGERPLGEAGSAAAAGDGLPESGAA